MRKLLICLTCLFSVVAELSADKVTALKVVMTDGTETLFVLPDKPVATFCGDSLLIASESMNVGYLRSAIRECCFEETDTIGMEIPLVQSKRLSYTYVDNRHVIIKGLEAGCKVAVYDSRGVLLSTQTVTGNDTDIVVDLEEQSAGMYMITITDQPTIKVINR